MRRTFRAYCAKCDAAVSIPPKEKRDGYNCPLPCGGYLHELKGGHAGRVEKQGAQKGAPVAPEVLAEMAPTADAPSVQRSGAARIHDCTVYVTDEWTDRSETGPLDAMRYALGQLRARGWTVTLDPETASRSACIAHGYFVGHVATPAGPLELCAHAYGCGIEVKFFQNMNRENPNGGRYDHDQWSRMPPIVRLRAACDMAALARAFAMCGYHVPASRSFEIVALIGWQRHPTQGARTALEYFNARWDSGYPAGYQRFKRDADGWPVAEEYRSWSYRDRDGRELERGAVYYHRRSYGDAIGRIARGTAWPCMNGSVILWTNDGPVHVDGASRLFRCDRPDMMPRRAHPRRTDKLLRLFDAATKAKQWRRVGALAGVLARDEERKATT